MHVDGNGTGANLNEFPLHVVSSADSAPHLGSRHGLCQLRIVADCNASISYCDRRCALLHTHRRILAWGRTRPTRQSLLPAALARLLLAGTTAVVQPLHPLAMSRRTSRLGHTAQRKMAVCCLGHQWRAWCRAAHMKRSSAQIAHQLGG
jgi:hypothetical protein